MRTEEDGGIQLEKEKLRLTEQATFEYECAIQEEINEFIETKLQLESEIEKMRIEMEDD